MTAPFIGAAACPLCGDRRTADFSRDKQRRFHRCDTCSVVFVPPDQHLSPADEKKRYDLHQNDPGDAGYRRFLSRVLTALAPVLVPGSAGLDFGSGPEPVLARMFGDAGFRMALYDPFFSPDHSALAQQYDFITATEVVEHLRAPLEDLDLLWRCLRPGGWLGIMTRHAVEQTLFSHWQYKNDLTHVCFFSTETFAWLGRRWGAALSFPDDDIALLRRPGGRP